MAIKCIEYDDSEQKRAFIKHFANNRSFYPAWIKDFYSKKDGFKIGYIGKKHE